MLALIWDMQPNNGNHDDKFYDGDNDDKDSIVDTDINDNDDSDGDNIYMGIWRQYHQLKLEKTLEFQKENIEFRPSGNCSQIPIWNMCSNSDDSAPRLEADILGPESAIAEIKARLF